MGQLEVIVGGYKTTVGVWYMGREVWSTTGEKKEYRFDVYGHIETKQGERRWIVQGIYALRPIPRWRIPSQRYNFRRVLRQVISDAVGMPTDIFFWDKLDVEFEKE